MDINELYYAIQEVNNDSSLDEERRNIRLTIYQALLCFIKGKSNLTSLMNEILSEGHKLEKLSDYNFFLNEDLEKTRIFVKGYILDSIFIQEVKEKGINKFTFEEIEKYLKQYIISTGNTLDDVSTAVSLYPKLIEYKNEYDSLYDKISNYLSKIFGEEMITNSGDIRLKYERINERIDRMIGRNLFNEQTKEWLKELINDLFAYYINNIVTIPIENQVDVSGAKELKLDE